MGSVNTLILKQHTHLHDKTFASTIRRQINACLDMHWQTPLKPKRRLPQRGNMGERDLREQVNRTLPNYLQFDFYTNKVLSIMFYV